MLDKVGVQLGLLAAPGNVLTGALGLDHRQRAPIAAIQHIVGITHSGSAGHALQLHLIQPVGALRPSGVHQHGIDISLAGPVLGNLLRLWHIALPMRLAPGGQFVPEGGVFLQKRLDADVLFERRRRRGGRGRVQQGGVKPALLIAVGIAIGHEVHEAEQVPEAELGLIPGDLLALVGGNIADAANKIHAPQDVVIHDVPEPVRVHQADQLVVPGHHKGAVHGIHPLHGDLHRPAAVQHAGRRVDGIDALRRHRHVREGFKGRGGKEEIEVGHKITSRRRSSVTHIACSTSPAGPLATARAG